MTVRYCTKSYQIQKLYESITYKYGHGIITERIYKHSSEQSVARPLATWLSGQPMRQQDRIAQAYNHTNHTHTVILTLYIKACLWRWWERWKFCIAAGKGTYMPIIENTFTVCIRVTLAETAKLGRSRECMVSCICRNQVIQRWYPDVQLLTDFPCANREEESQGNE